jgi:hypothetical protein
MPKSLKTRALYTLKVVMAFVPWVAAMYLVFWLDASGTWTRDTPHRGKMSFALLATGMAASLWCWTWLARRP